MRREKKELTSKSVLGLERLEWTAYEDFDNRVMC